MLLGFPGQAFLFHPHFMSLSCSEQDYMPPKSCCENALRRNASRMRKLSFGVSTDTLLTEHVRCCSQEGEKEKLVLLHTVMGTWFPAGQQGMVSAEGQTCQLSNKTWVVSLRRWLAPADSHCWTQQLSSKLSRNEPQATGAVNCTDSWSQRQYSCPAV